jgi:hypothetical protein
MYLTFYKFTALSLFLVCEMGWAADFVAGLAPDRRPVDAPTVQAYTPSKTTVQAHLKGVEPPAPANVRQVAEAGPWFIPMNAAGMTPPYDLRGHHPALSVSR